MKSSIAAILLSIFSAKSCEKKTASCDCKLEGLWSGTYSVDQNPKQGKLYYSIVFKPGGTLITEGKGSDGTSYYSSGKWDLNGTDLNCEFQTINFPYGTVVQRSTFQFNSQTCQLTNGKWKDIQNGPNTGEFQLSQIK